MHPLQIKKFTCFGAKALLIGASFCSLARAENASKLETVAESNALVWNGVAVDGDRIFVSGARVIQLPGSKAPCIALLGAKGQQMPYPDAVWNSFEAGKDATHAFVNVNAIHNDNRGSLWAVDTGSFDFGGDPLPGGAKAVQIDLKTNRVVRVYSFGPSVAMPGSYVNDIRFHGDCAYLTDSGRAGLIVLNLKTGEARRVLDRDPSTTGRRPIVVDGAVLRAADGSPLQVNVDPLEISPDGKRLYFGPAGGPWSAIETGWLDDASAQPAEIAAHVVPWADLPPTGGTAMDGNENLYFSDLADLSLKRRAPDGTITTVLRDARLHWIDAPAIDERGYIWLPIPQLDRAAVFNHGQSKVELPVRLYRLKLSE